MNFGLLKAANSKKLSILGPRLRKLLKIPLLGGRAREIIWALDYLEKNYSRKRIADITHICEFGVSAGEGFRQLILLADAFAKSKGLTDFQYHGFDTFSGMPETDDFADKGSWRAGDFPSDKPLLEKVLNALCPGRYHLYEGMFDNTLKNMHCSPALILIDCDYYTSTKSALMPLLPLLQPGSVIYFDDLGTNFYNPNLGEEKFIYEVNRGLFGKGYYLEKMTEKCYVFSNSEKAFDFEDTNNDLQVIPLKTNSGMPKIFF